MSVLVGARRFAHVSLLRGDRALHALLGMTRFPTEGQLLEGRRETRGASPSDSTGYGFLLENKPERVLHLASAVALGLGR